MHGVRAVSAHAHGIVARGRFVPHPLLRSAHLQTIFPTLCRPRPPVHVERERIELDDSDFVDLGWLGDSRTRRDGPILLMVHGLGGGFESKYALGLGQRLAAYGWRSVILQLRGAGPEPNRLARCYHHGDTADFHIICRLLRRRVPDEAIYAAGWSLGANVVLKAAGETGTACLLSGVAAASVPFNIAPCAEHLRHGATRVYQSYLMHAVRANLRFKHRRVPLPPGADLDAALRAHDFFAFDDAYTAPINGFADSRDYYAQTSCGQFLRGIACPTLIVHARDDPFMVPGIIPPAEMLSPAVRLELCDHGGHVGFVSRGPHGVPDYWLGERIASFLEAQRAGSHIASP
ncbi:MAG TPA: hydrolase [Nevskiaceae bacterium]